MNLQTITKRAHNHLLTTTSSGLSEGYFARAKPVQRVYDARNTRRAILSLLPHRPWPLTGRTPG